MILSPIPRRCRNRHPARIRHLIILYLYLVRAALAQLVMLIFRKGGNQLRLPSAGTNTIAKPERPLVHFFLEESEVIRNRTGNASKVRQVEHPGIQTSY